METLVDELLKIMDEECKGYDEWEENKPIVINVYIRRDN